MAYRLQNYGRCAVFFPGSDVSEPQEKITFVFTGSGAYIGSGYSSTGEQRPYKVSWGDGTYSYVAVKNSYYSAAHTLRG